MLFNYLIVKDSMQYKNNSYLQLLPPLMFDEMSNSMNNFQELLNKENFTDAESEEIFGLTKEKLIEDFYDKHFRFVKNLNQLRSGKINKAIISNSKDGLSINMFNGVDNNSLITEEVKNKNKDVLKSNFEAIKDSGVFSLIPRIVTKKDKDGKDVQKEENKIGFPLYFKRTVVQDEIKTLKLYKLSELGGKPFTYDMIDSELNIPIGVSAKYTEVSVLGNTNADVLPFALDIAALETIAKLDISKKIMVKPTKKIVGAMQDLSDMSDKDILASAPASIFREPNISKALGTEEYDELDTPDDLSDEEITAGLEMFERKQSKFNPAPTQIDLSNFQKQNDFWVNPSTGEKLSQQIYQSLKEAEESKKVQQDKKTDC
jgi:hypothetical protein